jgi:effector-binding domain-containing protein
VSFDKGELEFESGFPVAGAVKAQGGVEVAELPAGQALTTVHTGSQETSEKAYEALHAFMAKAGKAPAGAPWESYGEGRMEIYFPVR